MMGGLFLESAVRASLVAAATATILRLMRVQIASAQHRAWAGVLGLMLLLPMMPGDALAYRIRRLFAGASRSQISRTRMSCLIAACVLSSSMFAAARLAPVQVKPDPIVKLEFEVASIKVNPSGVVGYVNDAPVLREGMHEPKF